MHRTLTLGLLAAFLWTSAAMAQPTTQPAEPRDMADDDFVVSKMRVQELPAHTFFYREMETSLQEIGAVVEPTIMAMFEAIKTNNIDVTGSVTFVYHGASPDPAKKFKLQIGILVADGTAAVSDFQVRKLEALKCSTVLFSGPMMAIARAYNQLFTDLMAAGLAPTGETRETYLLWESAESKNNVVLVQAGIR